MMCVWKCARVRDVECIRKDDCGCFLVVLGVYIFVMSSVCRESWVVFIVTSRKSLQRVSIPLGQATEAGEA
jgi:hypothetical protein